jgi:hypothetical protein
VSPGRRHGRFFWRSGGTRLARRLASCTHSREHHRWSETYRNSVPQIGQRSNTGGLRLGRGDSLMSSR